MLRVIAFLSVDGVMQAPGSPEEDTEGGFRHGGWQRPYADEVLNASAHEGLASTAAYLFGRKTYEKMAAFWPHAPEADPIAAHLNATPKYVASRTLTSVDWHNSTLIDRDLPAQVGRLKERVDGNVAVLGSGELVRTLLGHDLVDELLLAVFPVLLGHGKRLFRGDHFRRLELVGSRVTTTGGVLLTYRPQPSE